MKGRTRALRGSLPRHHVRPSSSVLVALLTLLLVGSLELVQPVPVAGADRADHPSEKSKRRSWHATWSTAHDSADTTLEQQTVRTIVRLTEGGRAVRLSFAQDVAPSPVVVTHVALGRRDGERGMRPGTVHRVTFGGKTSFELQPGSRIVSDPIRLAVRAQEDVVVDVAFSGRATPSAHRSAYQNNYLSTRGSGDRAGEPSGQPFTQTTASFLLLSTVEVLSSDIAATVAVVGGSVVDGQGSRQSGVMGLGGQAPANSRWSDVLARRLLRRAPPSDGASVVNAGISANTAARECAISSSPTGNVQERFDRDVLGLAGLTHVIVYAGTNDVGMPWCSADQIIDAYEDLARRTHVHGARILFATITPRLSYTALQNDTRDTVNRWLLRGGDCSGWCDAVLDFDAAVAWSRYPDAIDPALDSGDTVHPNAEGYRRIARSIPLRLFASARIRAPHGSPG